MASEMPCTALNSNYAMPVVAMGTGYDPTSASPEAFQQAMLDAIRVGYRHFDTATLYRTEKPLGEAIQEAIHSGLVKSRDELFITTKLWITDCYKDRVVPALRESLRNLQLEYVDLYLIHWPISSSDCPTSADSNASGNKFNFCQIDYASIWEAMEECNRLGLTKSIGVSNFTCKKLEQLFETAKIPPAVNQVELHPVWQQGKLLNFCKQKGIRVTAYSPLGANGASWGTIKVMVSEVLKDIASKRGKSVAQVSLRWIYEQGATFVAKSFNKERMTANTKIFDWELSNEELEKISQIPQWRGCRGIEFLSDNGPFKTLEELWDGEV